MTTKSKKSEDHNTKQVSLSYYALRKRIGLLGMVLPCLLFIGNCYTILPSISHYYYSKVSVVFTGVLFSFGLFLFSYKIKNQDFVKDNIITNIAGLLAIIVALVPTGFNNCDACAIAPNFHDGNNVGSIIHLGSAFLFFVLMAVMSYFFFTKGVEQYSQSDPKSKALLEGKKIRNRIYRWCGRLMAVLLAALVVRFALTELDILAYFFPNDVYFMETALLLIFGFSWLVKGKALSYTGISAFANEDNDE